MKKRSIRDEIVSTATRLFYRQGYSNTGINQIIDEARIAKSSLYKHFRSKEDLLLAYLQSTGEQTITTLRLVADRKETPGEKIMAIFEYLEDLVQQEAFYGCHFLNMVYEMPEEAARVREQIKKQKDGVRALFEEILAPVHEESLADEVYCLFEGALIGNKVHSAPWPVVSARNIIKKLL